MYGRTFDRPDLPNVTECGQVVFISRQIGRVRHGGAAERGAVTLPARRFAPRGLDFGAIRRFPALKERCWLVQACTVYSYRARICLEGPRHVINQ